MSNDRLPWDNRGFSDKKREELLEQKILDLTLPPHNKKRKEIAPLINRSESYVWRMQRKLIESGKLNARPSGHIVKDKPARDLKQYEEITKTQFVKIAAVEKWVTKLRQRKVKHIAYFVTNFYKVCKTLDVSPNAFLGTHEQADELHRVFVEHYHKGEVVYIRNRKIDVIKQSQANPKHYTKAIKSFRKANNLENPPGFLIITDNQSSLYARQKLTDRERKLGIQFFRKIDEELANIFILHNELGVRSNTLFTIKPVFERVITKVDGLDCEYYVCTIIEEKQEEPYEKVVITPEGREVIKKLVSGKAIHTKTNIKKAKEEYNQKLREFYAFLERISPDPQVQENYEVGTPEYYYVNDPTHVIRHSCIHWLMRVTGYRADVVANMFWDTPETLKIYHKVGIKQMLQYDVCYYCNPPGELSDEEQTFCSLNHAIRYYNHPYPKQKL